MPTKKKPTIAEPVETEEVKTGRMALTAWSLFDQTKSTKVRLKQEARISLAALLYVIMDELIANAEAQRTTNPDQAIRVAGQRQYFLNGVSILKGVIIRLDRQFDLFPVITGEKIARTEMAKRTRRGGFKKDEPGDDADATNGGEAA